MTPLSSEWQWSSAPKPTPDHRTYERLTWRGMILGTVESFSASLEGPYYGTVGTGAAPIDYISRTGPQPSLESCQKMVEANVLRALKIALASSDGGVRVRELNWRQLASDMYEADVYSISDTFGQGPRKYVLARATTILGYFTEIDAAKAAAQADYEQRILSALEAPAAGDGEPVAWRWQEEGWGDYWIYNPEPGWLAEQNNIVKQPLYTAPPADAGMREALGAELSEIFERFLSAHEGDKAHLADVLREWLWDNKAGLVAALTAPGATTKSDGGDLIGYVKFSGPAVDALNCRKESDNGPTEDQVTADARCFISKNGLSIKPGPSDPSSTRSDVTWQSIESAPKDGTPIDVRAVSTFRYQPYKPNSDQRRKGILGRWQTIDEYGGWNNCAEPQGEWRPNDGKNLMVGVR